MSDKNVFELIDQNDLDGIKINDINCNDFSTCLSKSDSTESNQNRVNKSFSEESNKKIRDSENELFSEEPNKEINDILNESFLERNYQSSYEQISEKIKKEILENIKPVFEEDDIVKDNYELLKIDTHSQKFEEEKETLENKKVNNNKDNKSEIHNEKKICKYINLKFNIHKKEDSFEKVFDIKKIDKETKAKEQEKQKLMESSKLIATKRQMKDDAVLKKAKVRFFKWLRRYLIKIVPNEELTNPKFGKLTQEFIANVNYKNMRDTMDTKLIDIYQNHSENEYDYITIFNLIQKNNELRKLINKKIEDLYELYLQHQFKYDFEKIKTKYKNYDYLKRVWDISNDLINFIHEKKAYEKRKPKISKEQKLAKKENNKDILEEKIIIDLIINNEKTFKNLNLKDELMKRKRKY